MICSSCNTEKPLDCFPKNNTCTLGVSNPCKECRSEYHKQWRKENKDKVKKAKSLYMKEYRVNNKESIEASKAEWQRRRQIKIKEQTPSWANIDRIKEIYKSCRKLSKKFGVEYQVDHIVPINGVTVCGLHVENNLQLLEKSLNAAKSNKLKDPTSRYY